MEISRKQNDSARPIKRHLIEEQERVLRQPSSNHKIPIFQTEAFWVESMNDPLQYLPNDRIRQGGESVVEMCQHCWGECAIIMSHCCACCCNTCYMYELETSKVGLVEKFGRFSRLLTPGFNFINPCSEEVREIDMKIKVFGAGATNAITKDNVEIKVISSAAYRIFNPVLAYYRIGDNLERGISELVTSSFRTVIGVHNLQEVLTDRLHLIEQVKEQILANMPVGIKIENVFLEDITVPASVERDLSSVAKEKRIAEASIINSRADVESAALMRETAELLDTKTAMQIRYLELVESLGKRGATVLMEVGIHKKGFKEDAGGH